MAEHATVALEATDRLLGDLADGVAPLRAVGDALTRLADGLGVAKVVVAVDDPALGRQVFCSGRRPLGDDGVGLAGPPGAWSEPPHPQLDDPATLLLVRAIGVGVGRATRTPARVHTAPQSDVAALVERAEPADLTAAVVGATARAVRHGWGFTLVLARGGAGLTDRLRPRLRAADTLVAVSDHELALVLPETAGDRVPQVLARLAQGGGVPSFSYGLVCCPADGTDAAALCRTAAARLDEALRAAATPPQLREG